MKSKIKVSSFFGGLGFRIAEVGDGFGKDLGSAMGDSSSNSFTFTFFEIFYKIFVRMFLLELAETCKNEPPEAILRSFEFFLSRPI